jgi:CBS domain-containing protein
LADDAGGLLDRQVAEIMTVDVVTCSKETSVEDLARTMTERRIRHVPVVDADGALVGIVSIGDVVKSRISELEGERDDLVGYIGAR